MNRKKHRKILSEERRLVRNAVQLVALLASLGLIGALGFQIIEGWNFSDAIFMAVTTLTTVGYGEIHPLSDSGRLFVILYLVMGLGLFLFGIVQLGEVVLRTQLRDWLGRKRMDTAIKQLNGHYIVCGFGRMGRTLCQQFSLRGLPFVVVDKNAESLIICQENGWHHIRGDATDDEVLTNAGVTKAKGLAVVVGSDADNLYVVLSARLLNKELTIIARSSDDKSAKKLQQAGATRVVSLYSTGAMKAASLLLNPNVDHFFETVSAGNNAINLTEISVPQGSPYAGKALNRTDFGKRGVVIVGLRRGVDELLLPVPGTEEIRIGDSLIALGKAEAIAALIM